MKSFNSPIGGHFETHFNDFVKETTLQKGKGFEKTMGDKAGPFFQVSTLETH